MIIRCENFKQFITVIASLTERGIGFDAAAGTFQIKLTGGH